MSRNYLYSVTDKALYDALNQSKITNNELRDLFLTRGVITSKQTDRKVLAKNFSKYNHDYYDHQRIASALGTSPRREKTTSSFVSSKLDMYVIEAAAEKLKEKILGENDLCQLIHRNDGSFAIDITYQSTDYNKSEFKQIVKRTAVIEIEKSDEGYIIRRPDNDQVKEYESLFLANVEIENEGQSIEKEEITLVNITDPILRTEFFEKLIKGIPGLKVKDVTDVYVYHPKPEDAFEDEEDANAESGVHITKVSLKGEGVLVSDELDSLYERGFYIWKIQWLMEEELPDPDIFEFEAQFSDAENFTGFSYMPKKVKRYKGNGEYNKTKTHLTPKEHQDFTKLIELTARKAMKQIVDKAQGL